MQGNFERLLGDAAAALVETSRAWPRVIVALAVLLTAGSIYVAVAILTIDTDSDRLLDPNLPVRRTNIALAKAFPELQRNLVVMVEADDPHDARDAAEELEAALAREPERYPGLFLPGADPFYDDFGLYYLERDELVDLAARMEEAGPLLAALEERPELPILLGALAHVIGSVEGLASLGDDGVLILDRVSRAVEQFNAGGHAPIVWDDLLFEDLGGLPDNPQLLIVRPVGDLSRLGPVQQGMAGIRERAAELTPRPGLRVRITGDRAVHTEEMSLVVGEAAVSAVASLVLVTLILLLSLRSLRLVVATLITLLTGLIWTAGVAGIAVGELSALTSAFAVIYIGLAVDFGIHFGLGYLEQRGLGHAVPDALYETGESTGSSLLLCALTTAIGFYAFIPTGYTGVADMGIISGSGVLLGLLATLTLYPALISLGLGESRRPSESLAGPLQIRLPTFPNRYPRVVCGVAAVLTIGCAASLAWLRFDTNTLNVRDPRVESVQALKDLLADQERSVWTIEVLTRDLREAREVTARLEALPDIHEVRNAESFLPDEQPFRLATFERMRADLDSPVELSAEESGEELDRLKAVDYTIEGYGVALDLDAELRDEDMDEDPILESAERLRVALLVLNSRLQDTGGLTDLDALEADLFAQLPELVDGVTDALPTRTVTLEDLPANLVGRYLAPDGRARVEVLSSRSLAEPGELERFSDLVHTVRPDAGGPAAGTVELARTIVAALQQALGTAVVLITLLLVVLWRSLKYTWITLAPLLVGAVCTAAFSVFADIPLNFANIIVLPLILGIGVDSGIHLVHRHRSGPQGPGGLLRTSTANAVFFSALTTGGSFTTLALSNHLGISSLAQLLTVGITLMLAANLIVLPAILVLADE